MQPHTLSCSCAGHPVIKLTAARDSELKKKACCQRLSYSLAANVPGSDHAIIPVLQGITGLCVRGPLGKWTLYVLCRHQTSQKCMILWILLNKSDLAYDSPHSHSPHQPPPPPAPLVSMTLAAESQSTTGGHAGRTGHYCCALQRELLAVLLRFSLDHP